MNALQQRVISVRNDLQRRKHLFLSLSQAGPLTCLPIKGVEVARTSVASTIHQIRQLSSVSARVSWWVPRWVYPFFRPQGKINRVTADVLEHHESEILRLREELAQVKAELTAQSSRTTTPTC